MIFREATQEDLEYMAEHSINRTVDRKQMERVDYIFTLEHDGNILGIGGFRMIIPTTAWVWVDLSEYGVKHLRDSYRVMQEWMETFVNTHKIVRLQAFVKNEVKHIRLVQHLGFERESTMEKFYGDDDGFMYKRCF